MRILVIAQALVLLSVLPAATAQPEPAEALVTDEAPQPKEGLTLGSYGRIDAGTDFEGSSPSGVNVVSHGSRVVQPTYLELDLYYRLPTRRGVQLATVTTMAFANDLFHFDGEFDSALALRNFYLAADRESYGVWAGSRMVRGDDIYLLDFWPLDDVNTLGAGAWHERGMVRIEGHVGVNRLLDPFQFQEREVDRIDGPGSVAVAQLDRQRFVASIKPSVTLPRAYGELGVKAAVYGEAHGLPSGERRTEDEMLEALPSDAGWRLGAEVGGFGLGSPANHVNLFVRYSKGLAAFDELATPTGLSQTRRAYPASELLLGYTANVELLEARTGLMLGGYSRRFIDADRNTADRDDGWEYIVDARPWLAIAGGVGAALDVSFQARLPRGVSPRTLTAMDPAVFQIAPMLTYSPLGSGAFARPQLRLVYRAAHQNAGARDLLPSEDPRGQRDWLHYAGIQAEWWFNSTYR